MFHTPVKPIFQIGINAQSIMTKISKMSGLILRKTLEKSRLNRTVVISIPAPVGAKHHSFHKLS
jgi:hypothetical protein